MTLFTDGACEGNPGPGGYAAILSPSGELGPDSLEITGAEAQTTNNRMEMMAVIQGLEAIATPSDVLVVSDSQYVIKGITQWIHGWKKRGWRNASGQPVKNRDLWERLDSLCRIHRVQWEWVRGHEGHPGNERADFLAREAINS